MTAKNPRQQMKRLPSALSPMVEPTQRYQSAAVNTKAASGKRFTLSPASGSLPNITTTSTANTSNPTNSGKPPAPTAESPRIAAVLFRSTVLALLAAGLLHQGSDKDGNIVLVIPRQHWHDMKLKG